MIIFFTRVKKNISPSKATPPHTGSVESFYIKISSQTMGLHDREKHEELYIFLVLVLFHVQLFSEIVVLFQLLKNYATRFHMGPRLIYILLTSTRAVRTGPGYSK
jgi:hypothetical protein